MKKIVFIILLVLVIPFVFSGCGMKKSENYTITKEERFIVVEVYEQEMGYRFVICVDKQTRIMYLLQTDRMLLETNSMTVLLDADGKPQRYEGEL